jgi:hypothetical protein
MSCPPIYWRQAFHDGPHYGHMRDAGGRNFVVIGTCVGHLAGLYSVRIVRKSGTDLRGYAGSVEQAKRHVERWARSHWLTVG